MDRIRNLELIKRRLMWKIFYKMSTHKQHCTSQNGRCFSCTAVAHCNTCRPQLMADTQLQQSRCLLHSKCKFKHVVLAPALHSMASHRMSGDRQRNSTIAFRGYVSGNWKCTGTENKTEGKKVTTMKWQPGLFIQKLVSLIYWHVLDHVPAGFKRSLELLVFCRYSHCCIEGCGVSLSLTQNETHTSCTVRPKV